MSTICLTSVQEIQATWSIRLAQWIASRPAKINLASLGLPGQTVERLDRVSVALAAGRSTTHHRPEWSGISYQPRMAQPFSHGRIRRIGGRTVEQFYGIYDNPDARQVFYLQDHPWRCTGHIFTYTSWPMPNWNWRGSGVLIGPRHLLTAGHLVPWGSQTWPCSSSLRTGTARQSTELGPAPTYRMSAG